MYRVAGRGDAGNRGALRRMTLGAYPLIDLKAARDKAHRAPMLLVAVVVLACCLRPGVPGVSGNIRVRSLVGRFLEHSRVYWFQNGDQPEIYCSSADWLERNLLRRVETCFPILDAEIAKRVYDEEIENYLADNQQAWSLNAEGRYARIEVGDAMPHSAQQSLLARLCG